MADHARVTSLEAMEAFRAKLVIYREKAARVVDEVSDDVTRTRLWLQTDRVAHWQREINKARRELEQRQQELFSSQLSGLRDASFAQQNAVQKARRKLEETEERLKTVRQWIRTFDQRVEPQARQLEKLRHVLSQDLGQALAWMAELIKSISAYAEISLPPSSASAASPSGEGDVPQALPKDAST